MIDIFDNFYCGKRVLVTGHTGFKGSLTFPDFSRHFFTL